MWPWGHLAVGYLLYSVLLDRRVRRPPGELAAVVLAFGTQFPDLVDKPLAWTLGVIPHGRSLAHSALIATVVILVVGWYVRSIDRPALATAFGVGYYSHLVGDSIGPVLAGEWGDLFFLAWPLLGTPESTVSTGIVGFFAALARDLAAGNVRAFFLAELGLVVLACALWAVHGYPGLGRLRADLAALARTAD